MARPVGTARRAGRPGVLAGAVDGSDVGTSFDAHRRKLAARKLWIAFAARVAGRVTVDDGARRALVERGTSLLPAGVTEVTGRFAAGDTVEVAGADGVAFARVTPGTLGFPLRLRFEIILDPQTFHYLGERTVAANDATAPDGEWQVAKGTVLSASARSPRRSSTDPASGADTVAGRRVAAWVGDG